MTKRTSGERERDGRKGNTDIGQQAIEDITQSNVGHE
jgi:hypothetical protein